MDIEFGANGGLFQRLNVKSLPHVFRLASNVEVEGDGPIKIRADDVMKHADYSKFPWEAGDFASFVQEKVRLLGLHQLLAFQHLRVCEGQPKRHLRRAKKPARSGRTWS